MKKRPLLLSDDSLSHLTNIIQDLYSATLYAYTHRRVEQLGDLIEQQTETLEEKREAEDLRNRTFILYGLLKELVSEVHKRNMCSEPDCVKRLELAGKVFKDEIETELWWEKRFGGTSRPNSEARSQSDSF